MTETPISEKTAICGVSSATTPRRQSRPWRGIVVWLTGLPGSGKSTLGDELAKRIRSKGAFPVRLDGDTVRQGISSDLGFTNEDRSENVRRMAEIAALLCDSGAVSIVTTISPLRKDRSLARACVTARSGLFLEVFVDASVQCCENRDPKGLYRLAREGRLPSFTGVSAPYESPVAPDVHVHTEYESVGEATGKILQVVWTTLDEGVKARKRGTSPKIARRGLQPDRSLALATTNEGPILFGIDEPSRFLRLSAQEREVWGVYIARNDPAPPVRSAPSLMAIRTEIRSLVRAGAIRRRAEDGQTPYAGSSISSYTKARAVPEAVADGLISACRIGPDTRVLEIGSGPGDLARRIGHYSGSVLGIDINRSFLSIASRRAQEEGSRATFELMSGNELLWSSKSFDVCVSSQSFHWLNPLLALRAIEPALRSGGIFCAVETKALVARNNPMQIHFGYGQTDNDAIMARCEEHIQRYMMLFKSIGKLAVSPKKVLLFRERKTFDREYSDAFFGTAKSHLIDSSAWDQDASTQPFGWLYWLIVVFAKSESPHSDDDASPPRLGPTCLLG